MNTTTQLRNQCSASYLTSSITTRAQVERTYEEMERASRAMNAARGSSVSRSRYRLHKPHDAAVSTYKTAADAARKEFAESRGWKWSNRWLSLANSRAKNYARDI